MTEADSKRVEEIRRRFTADDVKWLLTQIDVLTFKLTNVTTERDVADQEIERLTHWRDREYKQLEDSKNAQLTAANAKVEGLRGAIEDYVHNDTGRKDTLTNLAQALADTEEKRTAQAEIDPKKEEPK